MRFAKYGLIISCLFFSGVCRGEAIARLVIFGDSLSDTGNLLKRTTGGFFDPRPTPPCYTRGRFTDGADSNPAIVDPALVGVWHERLSRDLNIPVAIPSTTTGGTNYAFGGATTGAGSNLGIVDNMGKQVSDFLTGKTTVPTDSLYVFWGGANDIINAATGTSPTPAKTLAAEKTAIANLKSEIMSVAAKNGKSYLWPNLPPLELTPTARAIGAADIRQSLADAARDFAADELAAITNIKASYPTIEITPIDIYSKFNQIIAHPADFGIANVQDYQVETTLGGLTVTCSRIAPAGTNPDTYLFWDSLHPTTRAHAILGDAVAAAVPEPSSLAVLGLAGMLLSGRRRSSRHSR